ncbi:MAG TPA: AAA family ATPase [Chlamydiales bacterium]|nr:AAA family ATPase [Chlamydiales bacterium]
MYQRTLNAPLQGNQSFFLFGPRGTGKTSWTKSHVPNALRFDLLSTDTYIDFQARPSLLEERIPIGFNDWIVIDGIQRIPELLNEVHRLIESKKYKFILTGSSARSLRKKGVNLLAGRAHSYKMFPLTSEELGPDFQLFESIRIGHLPAVHDHKEAREEYFRAYIETYLREEVLQEGLTRNLSAFARFLEIASLSQGSVLNISEVARESRIDRKVAENYFTILEDLLIATRLPVFTKKAKRATIIHPKFYYFDAGIYSHIRPKGPLDTPELIGGVALETLVYQELRAINEYYRFGYELFFWRTVDQQEIDFVLYGPLGLIAIEVKTSKFFDPSFLRSLTLFKEEYPIAKTFLFYGGKEKLHKNGTEILPLATTLPKLSSLLKL